MTRTLALTVLLLATGSVAMASPEAPAARPWESLSDADRAALIEPMRERWERATPEQQQRYLDRARFWASLSPEQKRLARAGAERWRQSDADQRGRLREVWQRFQSLPPAERDAARRTWESLSPPQRRAWLDAGGPGVVPPPTGDPPR
ncbi:hypothetical protein GCM10028794_27260 [Silanimonas algicola]